MSDEYCKLQAILTNKPVCHIEGNPTWRTRQKGSDGQDIIRIVHNCEHVTLYINGSLVSSEFLSITIPPPQYNGKALNPYVREWKYNLPLGTSRISAVCGGCGLGYFQDRNRMMGEPVKIVGEYQARSAHIDISTFPALRFKVCDSDDHINAIWTGNRTVETAIEQRVVPYHDSSAVAKRLEQVSGEKKLTLVVKKKKMLLAGNIQVYRISIQLSDMYTQR